MTLKYVDDKKKKSVLTALAEFSGSAHVGNDLAIEHDLDLHCL